MNKEKCLHNILDAKKILIVQDIDGVCVPLVKDPLKRKIDPNYIYSVCQLKNEFFVLTCGEHEGRRGVNRLIETSIASNTRPAKEGLYLPGLAACGVEYQDKYGNCSVLGMNSEEIEFLKNLPLRMEQLLKDKLTLTFPNIQEKDLNLLIEVAVCDTRFTPTINLNEILPLAKDNLKLKIDLQLIMLNIMNELINTTGNPNLENSFYLHMMPNLGKKNSKEMIKLATKNDTGTTDIQFIINGAVKECGLLVLLNKYIENETGSSPFGKNFNVREAPKTEKEIINLCTSKIKKHEMPLLVGVGDTVTSTWSKESNQWLRGGSDRGFLTLIQKLGEIYNLDNKIIFVNSNNEEVRRPCISPNSMKGISDPSDTLKFDAVMMDGPSEYIDWFAKLAEIRSSNINNSINIDY